MKQIEKDLKKNGFVLIKGFLLREKNFISFKRYLDNFLTNIFHKKKKLNLNLSAGLILLPRLL